jgi:ParB-like chromosome segregation protein Spo0J
MESLPISKVRPNSDNPRYIKDEKFKKLVQSLRDFPEMATVRPIVVNTEMVVLAVISLKGDARSWLVRGTRSSS